MKSGTDPWAQRYLSMVRSTRPRLRLVPAPDSATTLTVPHEVNRAIADASRAYETLQTSGRRLHFTINRADGTVAAVLQDLNGNPLDTLSASQVLRLAGGGSAS